MSETGSAKRPDQVLPATLLLSCMVLILYSGFRDRRRGVRGAHRVGVPTLEFRQKNLNPVSVTSIKQSLGGSAATGPQPRLPNFCNLGVMLRLILVVNASCIAAVIVKV